MAVLLAKSAVFFVVLAISMITNKASNPGRAALFAIFATQSNDFAIGYPMSKFFSKILDKYAKEGFIAKKNSF